MTELELIVDLHRYNERQGPGSQNETLRALEMTGLSHKPNLQVTDIGCGTGGQTFTLAKSISGQITAVDLFPEFLQELDKKAQSIKLQCEIPSIEASMDNLPFKKESLDLIWSEGAIYNMGFEQGIKNWKDYLKPGGYISVSEITWITNARPKEIEDFWNQEYPEISTASGKIATLENNSYTLVGYFALTEDSWIKNYYEPLESQFPSFLKRHDNSELAKKVVQDHRDEMELYLIFKEYYSYGFYIARKNED